MTAKQIYELIKAKPYKDGEKLIKEYTKRYCKKQRELCSLNLMIRSEVKTYPENYKWFGNIIENTPNPKLK